MKKAWVLLSFTALFAICFSHPLKLSVSKINRHQDELIGQVRLFQDDFSAHLAHSFGLKSLDFKKVNKAEREAVINYFMERLYLVVNENRIHFAVEDISLIESDLVVQVKIRALLPKEIIYSSELYNGLMTDAFPNQKNLVYWRNKKGELHHLEFTLQHRIENVDL